MAHQAQILSQAPFYVIPGISPSDPIPQQAEQIDQLNTLLLQEIDANFAKFHQVITTRILPQIKRYAIAAEPVREGAKFWRSFYEAAADVHVQIASDDSLAESAAVQHEEAEEDRTFQANSDASFMFADGAVASSTPLAGRAHAPAYDSSFPDSLASPFDTLERRLRDDLQLDESEMPTPSLPSGYDLSGLEQSEPVIAKPSSATPKARRPAPVIHNGIVDIRSTPLNAKFRPKLSLADLDIDDDDDVQLNMSPPVTMQYQIAPRAAAILSTGRTPKAAENNDHAQRIIDGIMDEMSAEYIPSPRIPTPDQLRRYSVLPGAPQNIFAEQIGAASGQGRRSMANTSFGSDMEEVPENHVYSNDDSMDDSFDSPEAPRFTYNLSTSSVGSDHSDGSTIFGGKPIPQQPQPRQPPKSAFNIMKPDEMVTFHGGRLEDAAGREVADTPTNMRQR